MKKILFFAVGKLQRRYFDTRNTTADGRAISALTAFSPAQILIFFNTPFIIFYARCHVCDTLLSVRVIHFNGFLFFVRIVLFFYLFDIFYYYFVKIRACACVYTKNRVYIYTHTRDDDNINNSRTLDEK